MNTTIEAIKQSDALEILGVTAAEAKEFREKNLSPDEWWKNGVTIVWSKEAFDRIHQQTALVQVPVANGFGPEVRPETLSVRAIKAARNPRYLYADLQGNRISVLCNQRKRNSLVGKTINVRAEPIEGETKYTHIP